ncbi:MAG: hypothetical protein IJR28_00505 [Ottowia sp.]|nr:hypothetical protein [Ottowia sp.]
MSEQSGGWQAAVQRAANAFIHYTLRQLKACSQWYAQAAGVETLQNRASSEIPVHKTHERQQSMLATDEYPSENAPGKRAGETGSADIPIASVHHYQ